MEPDKFEKHIKYKLMEREMKPSAKAWNKILSQLEAPVRKKTNRMVWYGVAASFIGVLIVATIYFKNQKIPVQTKIEVVETHSEPTINDSEQEVKKIDGNIREEGLVMSEESVTKENTKPKKEVDLEQVSDIQIVVTEKNMGVEERVIIITESEKLIDMKIAEVVAQIDFLEKNNLPVSDAEVDSLLRNAQEELLADKLFNREGKVDAMALLNEVEGELNQTFREQIFETLKNGFFKVKTAVADRNN